MIPKFNDYSLINESKTLKELEKGNPRNLSCGEMKKGFLGKGYEFLGNIYMEGKSINAYVCPEIIDFVPDDIKEVAEKYGTKDGYLSYSPDTIYVSVGTTPNETYDRIHEVLAEENIDKISSCFTMKHDLYYVLWNDDKKYFYFLRLNNRGGYTSVIGFAELWIKVRTSGADVVRAELTEIADKYSEIEKQEAEARRLKKEREDAIADRQDAIRNDYESNADNYKEIDDIEDLPEEVKSSLSDDDPDADYFKYKVSGETRWSGPYTEVMDVTIYINNKGLTDGYIYKKTVDVTGHHYWGD